MLSKLATWIDYRRRISHDPLVMGGEACVAGTRIPTEMVWRCMHSTAGGAYWVAAEFPALTTLDVMAVMWYENLLHRRLGRWWREHGLRVVRNERGDQ